LFVANSPTGAKMAACLLYDGWFTMDLGLQKISSEKRINM